MQRKTVFLLLKCVALFVVTKLCNTIQLYQVEGKVVQ